MYETPSRSSSRLNKRRSPALHAPSIANLNTPHANNAAFGGSAGNGLSIMSPGSPAVIHAPQTPQQRLLLRKPISMQTLSTVRSSSRLSNTPRSMLGAGAGGMGSMSSTPEVYRGKIHVGVRAKPPTVADHTSMLGGPWTIVSEDNIVDHDQAGNFQFDRVYDGGSTNADIFSESVESLVSQVVNGYNATVFAYGTTGSGKTFTMQGSDADPGVIQRSVHRLFDLLRAKGSPSLVQLSYFEIYNERVYDLLSADSKPTEVMIRDGTSGDTKVVGQREVTTKNAQELLQWVAAGDQLRRTSSTQYNEHSSRSHAVVRVQVTDNNIQSILYLCDLAGSERALVHTERRKEGSYINKSLLTLSTVISILSQGGGGHVPYRDSKLTRLLQPSLSGTALVSMLCTIQTGPPPAGGAETVNSVRFAAKAKNITVMAKRNSVFDDMSASGNFVNSRMVEQLQYENDMLRREASKLRIQNDDLQDRLTVLETSVDGNAEASLEAMSGISFLDDDVDAKHGAKSESSKSAADLDKELNWYKDENKKLHHRVSHLVSEITALDANIANLESLSNPPDLERAASESSTSTNTKAAAPASNDDQAALHAIISELKEQLKDRDLLVECLSGINDARSKFAASDERDHDPTSFDTTAEAIQDLRI